MAFSLPSAELFPTSGELHCFERKLAKIGLKIANRLRRVLPHPYLNGNGSLLSYENADALPDRVLRYRCRFWQWPSIGMEAAPCDAKTIAEGSL